jgi:hypothetical protein
MIREIFEFNTECLNVHAKEQPYLEHAHAMFCVKALREEANELQAEHLDSLHEGGDLIPVTWTDPTCIEARVQTVKSVDAALDAAYFAIGLLRRAGLTEDQAIDCFMAVHVANMTKKKGVNARRDTGVADAVKPADFVPPDLQIYEILYGPAPEQVLELLGH